MYIYRHRSILLKEFRRVLDDRVVRFTLVRDSYRFFNGFFAYESNSLRDDLDLATVPDDRRYKMAMLLKEARYAILARHWRTMICHPDRFDTRISGNARRKTT